ncbi:MAG: hypothetical protein AAGF92_19365 [Myxococcota bacterium]
MTANWKLARCIAGALAIAVALILGATGCAGLSLYGHPTIEGQLRHEMVAETDLWMEESHPTAGDMELSYDRTPRGDLWMSAEDAGIPTSESDETDERELPPGLERLLDLMVTPSPGPRP